MLTFEQIKELVELVAARRLSAFELDNADFRLKVEGPVAVAQPAPAATTTAAAAATAGGGSPATGEEVPRSAAGAPAPVAIPADAHVLTSPIVGTFYTAPSPDAPAFVSPGDRVRRGQVICIVEAMKLMNEIEADVDGTVLEVVPKNAQAVEFGEPLFVIRPS